jgi:hypothetical protein
VAAVAAEVTGEELGDRTFAGLWPSDHAGVVARLRLWQRVDHGGRAWRSLAGFLLTSPALAAMSSGRGRLRRLR